MTTFVRSALLLPQDPLRVETRARVRVRVDRDRRAGAHVRLRDRSHHALDSRGHPLLLDRALEERRTHTGVRDALRQILDEHLRQRLRLVEEQPGTRVVELEGDLVVGVQPRGGDDVEVGPLCDPLDARDVATQTQDRGVHDRVDPQPLAAR